MPTLRSLDGSDDEAAWHPPACSARLAQAAQSAEYKQVTVLFADVVRSMDIAATVGSERLREIMAPVALEDHAVHPSRSPSALRPGSGRVMAPSASRLLPN